MKDLKSGWQEITARYSSDKNLSENIYNHLTQQYSSSKRYYHNLQHIKNMLESIEEYAAKLADSDAVYFCILFHDVVYDSLAKDNEAKSADYARQSLLKLNFPSDRIEKVCRMILATSNHTFINDNENFDTQLLLDADLKILGAEPEDYLIYSQQVRKEYALVPDLLYKPGRKKVLKKFMDTPFLFRTKEFRERYEVRAKKNLTEEWATL